MASQLENKGCPRLKVTVSEKEISPRPGSQSLLPPPPGGFRMWGAGRGPRKVKDNPSRWGSHRCCPPSGLHGQSPTHTKNNPLFKKL